MAYSEEEKNKIFDEICYNIAYKGMALRNILKADNMPNTETFYRWLVEDDYKSKRYALATDERSDKIFEEIIEIADATSDDVIIDKDGNEIVNHNVIQRDRLRVDTRKWMVGKLNPKKYGDRVAIDQEIKDITEIKLTDATGDSNA